jgi:hypothetical protein
MSPTGIPKKELGRKTPELITKFSRAEKRDGRI